MQNKIKKLTYLNCDKDDHLSEPLSRICVQQECKNRTLVCAICEQVYHKNHETLPLKTYLTKIYSETNFETETVNPLFYTNMLDQIKNSFFNVISEHKREMTDMLDNIETQGKIFFNKVQQEVLSMMQISHPLDFMNQERLNAKRLKDYYAKMTKLINVKDKQKLSLQKKLQCVIDNCQDKEKRLSQALTKSKKQLETSLFKISTTLDETLVLSIKNPVFVWSQTLKGHKIKINETIADQTGMQSSGQRFIMLEPSLSQYGMKKMNWGIKIKKFTGWIGLGICLKNIIKNANYHFNYNNIGHGSYLISSNGYSWSHSVKEFNSASKTFHFTVNDIIYMEFDPIEKKLRFRKNKGNEKFQLTIVDPPANDEYHPCANICSNGDSVEVVNPGYELS